ncbi:MAG: molecular chaperone TorD family protein [Desulfuromonadaceae bacterium]
MLHVSERKQLYRFLAQLFVYPDQDLLASLCRGEADVAARLIDLEAPPLFSQNNLLELSPDNSSEPPDYLATELEFLYYLVEQEEEALHRRDVEEARDKSLKQKMFISELLNPWVSIFCRRVEQDHAAHPLYRWGCRLLERFCSLEREWIERLH